MKMNKLAVYAMIFLLIFSGCAPREEAAQGALSKPVQQTPQSGGSVPSQGEESSSNTNVQQPSDPDTATTGKTPVVTSQNTKTEKTTAGGKDVQQVQDLREKVRFFGRTYFENDVYYFNWTMSGFEFTFHGTGATACFESESWSAGDTAYILVYVDDGAPKAHRISEYIQDVVLAKNLKEGSHTIRVVKRTNARSSPCGLREITLDKGGKMLPPPTAKTRKIEFIGDSLMVGYGTLSNQPQESWSTKTEDGSLAFSALAAKAVNADYNVIAISGRGLAHNTDGSTDKLMSELYEQTDAYNCGGEKWDFSRFQPEVVVINLATNDQETSTEQQVTTAAKSFLQQVRKNNPKAYIIYAYGMLGNPMENAIRSAISSLGDSKISYLALQKANKNQIAVGHPNWESHQQNAKILEQEIRRVTGWY